MQLDGGRGACRPTARPTAVVMTWQVSRPRTPRRLIAPNCVVEVAGGDLGVDVVHRRLLLRRRVADHGARLGIDADLERLMSPSWNVPSMISAMTART